MKPDSSGSGVLVQASLLNVPTRFSYPFNFLQIDIFISFVTICCFLFYTDIPIYERRKNIQDPYFSLLRIKIMGIVIYFNYSFLFLRTTILNKRIYFPLIGILLLLSFNDAKAQQEYTLSGTIQDDKTNEILIGAMVYLQEMPKHGAISNEYGFYSITAPEGTYTLITSYDGYQPDSSKITLNKNISLNIKLKQVSATELEEVVVRSSQKDERITQPAMGTQSLSIKEIQSIPVLLGEKDVIKTIQLLPGIKSMGEGGGGFFVRGGDASQNLVLLDDAPVYNPTHLLGFFSSFNSDAIKDLTLYKGTMPAKYGGRLSSVLDIRMKDGDNENYHLTGGIGLITSRLTVEGPLLKNKGSFIVSGRRTYVDVFVKLSQDTLLDALNFYDLNAKANYTINENNKLYFSGYYGKDNLGLVKLFSLDYGNTTATGKWTHIFNPRLFSNTSLIYTNFNYNASIKIEDIATGLSSRIEDWSLKQDFQYYLNNYGQLSFGFNSIYHTLSPGVLSGERSFSLQKKYALENALYASHELSIFDKLNVNYGLRLSGFSIFGPGDFFTYDDEGNIIATASYKKGELVKTYLNLEPRVLSSYQLREDQSIKASYTRNVQNLHLISNTTSTSPTDVWIPSSPNVKPALADQFALGYYRLLKENAYEFSSEIYYKNMPNQMDYSDGAELNLNENIESQLAYGKGRAYGLELFLEKKTGKTRGWISYTLSRSERKTNGVNNNNWYPVRQDQTHSVSVVWMHQLNKRWALSANWVFNTGNAITYPTGKYEINGETVFYYEGRNQNRMPAYHRLDVGATLLGKKHKRWEGDWTFSIYNIYARQNPYLIYFEEDVNDRSKITTKQISLFSLIPSIVYNFKW